MTENTDKLLKETKGKMSKSVAYLSQALAKIRAGKAAPKMLDTVMVSYYNNDTPLSQVASVSTPDARTLQIKPWEKGLIPEIEKAIINSNLGFTPQNDGDTIRIVIPMLTEERRLQLVKQAKQEGENAKISLRNTRKEVNVQLKKFQKEGHSEDEIKEAEIALQEITNNHTKKIDSVCSEKEKEIMQV